MQRILITGGTVFVSRYVATYFKSKGHEVYVLNRGSKKQVEGVHLICADRNALNNKLKDYSFDTIIDVCGYHQKDIQNLLDAVGTFKDYIFHHTNQRDYFSFYDYEYTLDVSRQNELLPVQKDLIEGLKESYEWFKHHSDEVAKREYIRFIDQHLIHD